MFPVSRKGESREEILKKLRENVAKGIPIVGAGAGTGLSAKMEEAGGADLIIVYDSGWHRMNGRPSISGLLSMGDANGKVLELAPIVLPIVKHTPVLAGVLAYDTYRFMDKFLEQLKELGFVGVQNFPGYGEFSGVHRRELDEIGYGMENEYEMIRLANRMDMLTCPYVFSEEQCRKMIDAGADIIVVHCGCTQGGTSGVQSSCGLDHAVEYIQKMADLVHSLNKDALVICHGGPVAEPEDVRYLYERTTGVQGFFGASSVERLPVERAIRKQVEDFKSLKLR